jgi:hypothetical protein
MHEQKIECLIWGTPATLLARSGDGGGKVRSLRTGGDYRISGTAVMTVRRISPAEKARITTWIVDQRRSGEAAPLVTDDVVQEASTRRPLRMSERKRRFFLLATSRNFQPSDTFKMAGPADEQHVLNIDAIEAWTESLNNVEVAGLMRLLGEEGLVSKGGENITITAKGFERMEALESGAASTTQAFVAMWFDPSMDAAFKDGFEAAIEEAGYKAFRIDRKEHNNKIDDEIIAEIRRSRFVVADFTCGAVTIDGKSIAVARGGVYYEAGFAQGLNIPVIWSCHEDMINYVHFDTRQFNHITWKDPAELKTKLLNRIRAVIV